MAILPFGGIDDEPPIDPRSDPEPLLAEIAGCAYDGVAMRPQLARWFHDAWRHRRFSLKGLGGHPVDEPIDRRATALIRIKRLMEDDSGPALGKAARAIALVREDMQIEVTPQAMHNWLRELQAVERDEETGRFEDYYVDIVSRVRAHLNAGRTAEVAATLAHNEASGPRLVDIETVERWTAKILSAPKVQRKKSRSPGKPPAST